MKMYVLSLIMCCIASTLLAHPITIVDLGNSTIEESPTTLKPDTPAPAPALTTAIRSANSEVESMATTTDSPLTITDETTMLPAEEVTMLPKLHETYMLPAHTSEEEMEKSAEPPVDPTTTKKAPEPSEEETTEPPVDPPTTTKALVPSEEQTTEASIAPRATTEENKNGTSLCLVENKKCGFTTSNPPIHHGDCCQGLDCTYKFLGAGGLCTKGNEEPTEKPIEERVVPTTESAKCEDNYLCQWVPVEECQKTRAQQDCPKKCGICGKVTPYVIDTSTGCDSKNGICVPKCSELTEEEVINGLQCKMDEDNDEENEDADVEVSEEEDVIDDHNDGEDDDEKERTNQDENDEDNEEENEDAESFEEEDVINDHNDVGDEEEEHENGGDEISVEVDDMDDQNDGKEMMMTTTIITMTEDDDEKEPENTIENESEEVEHTEER